MTSEFSVSISDSATGDELIRLVAPDNISLSNLQTAILDAFRQYESDLREPPHGNDEMSLESLNSRHKKHNTCVFCGKSPVSGGVIPEGHKDCKENLITVCKICYQSKTYAVNQLSSGEINLK